MDPSTATLLAVFSVCLPAFLILLGLLYRFYWGNWIIEARAEGRRRRRDEEEAQAGGDVGSEKGESPH